MADAKFTKQLRDAIRIAKRNTDVLVRKTAFDAYKKITEKTPVDTGRAKGNWNISTKNPDVSVSDREASTPFGEPDTKQVPDDGIEDYWISNNVLYIEFLENGSSIQAPAGMVKVTFEELRFELRED